MLSSDLASFNKRLSVSFLATNLEVCQTLQGLTLHFLYGPASDLTHIYLPNSFAYSNHVLFEMIHRLCMFIALLIFYFSTYHLQETKDIVKSFGARDKVKALSHSAVSKQVNYIHSTISPVGTFPEFTPL